VFVFVGKPKKIPFRIWHSREGVFSQYIILKPVWGKCWYMDE